jgi:hypothetical protein
MRDGVNLSHNKQTKSVVTASQIMMLKDLEAYLKFPGDFPTSKVKFEYLDVPSRATAFVERPIEPSNPQNVYQPEDQQTESVTSEIMPVIKLEQA